MGLQKGEGEEAKWRAFYTEENHLVMEPIEAFQKQTSLFSEDRTPLDLL